ncbi:TolC family protein [Sandaracinus amylolyticus]|uniref:Copper tolerance protein n=1 Tax=Sandaracinus amylolyticus TaxID=927083 RepID=A0A0F6SDD2_9BACT|nr:TolC family protein [Sandaracinus amylolyticus]AKF03239.1 Copper tolerance protein [Sandaracinus amylolyticus]
MANITDRALALLLALSGGCASHAIREDVDATREIVRARADLELVDRDPERWQDDEPAVRELLAQPLTMESAVRIALLNNRDLRAELYELGIARAQLVGAGLLPNPILEAEARIPEDQAEPVQYDIGLAIDLTALVLAPLRAHAASARVEAARFRTAGAVLDLAYRVRLAFVRYQASAQTLELAQTALESFAASLEAARALYAAGNVRELDVAMEEAAYEQARIEVARAELEMLDDRERMNALLGLYGHDVTWEPAGRLPDPPRDVLDVDEALERRAIESSLELAWTRAELEAVGRELGLARTVGLVPDVEIGVHAEFDEERWEVGPEVAIGLPIFSQGQGAVLAREAELESMRERYVGIAIAVRASARAARNRALTAELLARRTRESLLPARTRVFEQTLLLYNAMQLDVFRLLEARRDQIDAARQYIDALREYWQARATLDQVLAGRLAGTIGGDGDLESAPSSRSRATRTAESPH